MTLTSKHDYPALCVEVGLNCESCTEASARELARACPDLPGKSVKQLFVQIHEYPACLPMRGNFFKAYAEASVTKIRVLAAAV